MKNIILFISGVLTGAIIVMLIYYYNTTSSQYIELQTDYQINGGKGIIKAGTLIKYDEGFSEGFTRYILYLNIAENDKRIKISNQDTKYYIRPYFIEPVK